MRQVVAAVHVVATDGPAGKAGLTATSVTSVSDAPPILLVCVNSASYSAQHFLANKKFCINVLSSQDQLLADIFAGRKSIRGAERFCYGKWASSSYGLPILETALATFECELIEARAFATHWVLFGQVQYIHASPGFSSKRLIYYAQTYHIV